jgi:hypothetical protein
MPSPKTVKAQADLSLENLRITVQQQEELLGPLTALDNATDLDGTHYSILTFDMDQNPPDKTHLAVLGLCVGGIAPARPNYTVVCTGTCYVTGQLQAIAAYRHS